MENTGKALSLFTLPLIGVVVAELLMLTGGIGNQFWGLVGAAMIVVGSILLIKEAKGNNAN